MKKICRLVSKVLGISMLFSILCVPALAVETPLKNEEIKVVNLETGDILDVSDYSVEVTEQEDDTIVKTVTADISLSKPETRSSVTDAGVTVRITCITSATNSGSNKRITKFDAKYELLDPEFTISSRHVKVGNYGAQQVQQGTVSNYIYDYYPTTNTFSKSYSNMPWVGSVGAPAFVGGYAECQISRGGSSWSLQCRDFVIENGLF